MKTYRGVLIFTGLALAILGGVMLFYDRIWGIATCAFALVSFVVLLLCLLGISKKQQAKMDTVFNDNREVAANVINLVSVPALIADERGKIVWRNEAFSKIYNGNLITEVLPQYKDKLNVAAQQAVVLGSSYQIMNMPLERRHTARKLIFQYWLDRTEAVHYQRLYSEQMPYIMLVYVDNYEELTSDLQVQRTAVLAQVEKLVSDLCKRHGGVYRRYENGRFLCILEAKQLELIEKERFALMEQVRRIDTGSGMQISISVAVGVAPRLSQSEEGARSAMELALGRGGDQAVVKEGTAYRFYGGKNQKDTNQSRVKTRLFSKALHQLFENTGDVFIMGHKHSDMDCMGAALGIMTCANHIGSHAYIVIDGPNPTIADALSHMEKDGMASKCILLPEQAKAMIRSNSVLVVVDTQRASTTVCEELIGMVNHLVLIDHHRRSIDHIENTTLHYLESRASSASEMVTEVIQYFADSVKPTAFTCSALLAGITVDTKQFAFNVGSRTFDAAGYLRRNGADLGMVKLMFQNDLNSYIHCANAVERAAIRPSGIAVSLCDKKTPNSKLTAAQAADELLGIKGVTAAFVLGEDEDSVAISGRSYGRVNVQLILERLGGGGHLTMAGAQLKGVSIEQARDRLLGSIEEYEANMI
ncbi:MAG: DHH family phosphoesterase [Clostridia bacterium]|nr:DHH family phosphoesterase [Clostridia bacterium]